MYSAPVTNINTLFEKNQNASFKILSILYKILQVITGLDFGFLYNPTLSGKFFIKSLFLIIFVSLFIVCLTMYDVTILWSKFWFRVFLAKYITYFLFLISLKSNASLRSFHIDLHSADSKFDVNSTSFKTEFKILWLFFFCFSFRITISIAFWTFLYIYVHPVLVQVIYINVLTCIDILLVSYAFLFHMVCCRLKKVITFLEKSQFEYATLQHSYKTYVDIVYKYKSAFDPVIVISLCYVIPEVMGTLYESVQYLRNVKTVSILSLNVEYVMAAEALVVAIAPAICADNLSSAADKIKILLHNKLLEETDKTKIQEIQRFIDYVEARGCRFRVCKVIPLDASLIKMVLNFCITYLIVIIQFTKEY